MDTDRPAYLKGKSEQSGLRGLDKVDTGEVKPWEAWKLDGDRVDLGALASVAPLPPIAFRGVGARDPDWLLKGTPRLIQIEALRRSYCGFSLFETEDEAKEGIERFQFLRANDHLGPARGWGHFLEQRLGKTPVALNEFMLLRRDHGFKNMVVLAPPKFKLDWPIEAERFGIDVPCFAFDSSDRKAAKRFIEKNPHHLISINYEALGYEATLEILEEIIGPETNFVSDESISIKNHTSKYTKEALELAKRAGSRRPLSGKPISQGPQDIYSQLRFLGALNGTTPVEFRGDYCKMGGFMGKTVVGIKKPEELHGIITANGMIARRSNWLKTPGRDYAPERLVQLLPEQLRMYNEMQENFLTKVREGVIVAADQIVTKLLKLAQISSGFIIDEMRVTHDIVPPDKNPKALMIKQMLEEEISGKTIIICVFRRSIDILREALAEFQPAIIRGQMDNDLIIQEKRRFNESPGCRILIGQSQATRYGHTLMGSPDDPCTTLICHENSYSLNDRSQLEERPQGEGQQLPITIFDLIATEQDRAPIRALQWKEDVASMVMRFARGTGILPPAPRMEEV